LLSQLFFSKKLFGNFVILIWVNEILLPVGVLLNQKAEEALSE
jgi:hypothetical protein